MPALTKKISLAWSETGKTVYTIIRREADSYRLDDADGAFAAAPADPYLSLAEDAVIKGLYEVSEARAAWNDGNYFIFIYRQTGATPVPASDMMIGSSKMSIINDAEVVNVNVLTQSNIDFGALQKVSLNAATPAVTVSDKAGFSLSATGADLILKSSTFIQAIIAAVNEFATYGLTALNTLLVITGIKTASTAAPADMALNSTVAKEATLATVAGYLDTEISAILEDTGTTLPATLTTIDGIVDAIKLKTDTLGGAGAITWTYTLTDADTNNPIDGAEVWVTTDLAGTNVIASGITNTSGVVTFYLDATAAIYIWRRKSGYNFTNPDQEAVT